MDMDLRPFVAADYPSIASLASTTFPDYARSADEVRFDDEHRPAYCRAGRWIADRAGRMIGFGEYSQHSGAYDPHKYSVFVFVEPDLVGRGIGSRLFDVLLDELAPFEPQVLDSWSREDMTARVGFLERRGFVADMRMWASELDLAHLDLSPLADQVPAVEAQGIRLTTLADLMQSDPLVYQRLYDLWDSIRRDVPAPDGEVVTDVPFEEWRHSRVDHPGHLPEGYHIAVDGERYIGLSSLYRSPDPTVLRTGITGVRREYRRRGIASALKARALDFARAAGFLKVLTENASTNVGMLSINEAVGFVKRPVWVHYRGEWSVVRAASQSRRRQAALPR